MRVLLVNPPIDNMVVSAVPDYVNYQLKDSPMPPLGLMYLASYITTNTTHEVKIADLVVEDTLLRDLDEYNPHMVGITVTTLTLYDALQVAKTCKLHNPGILVVMGGAHCNIYPDEILAFVDFVVRGDGEISLVSILNSMDSINTIITIEDLDSLPFPARHLIDNSKYHSTVSKGRLVTSMITSRGCPYNCSFCYQPHYGKRWRVRSARNVVAEIEEIVKLGINEIEVYDDVFTYKGDRAEKICDMIITRNLNIDWAIRTRVDCVNPYLLKLMAKAGCKRINYGIESTMPSVLKTLRKGYNMIQVIDALRWTIDAGIEIQAYFMLGSPGETKEQILKTIEFANKYIPDYAYYSITSPLPETDLYKQGLKEGRYNDYWEEFAVSPTAGFTAKFWDDLPREELLELMEYGFKSFYGRPKYILGQLGKTRTLSELVRKSKMAVRMLK